MAAGTRTADMAVMQRANRAWRIGLVMVLSMSSAVCAARAMTQGGAYPSPFPNVPSPTAIKPNADQAPWSPVASAVLKTALRFQGVPYLWGGDSPASGFDCSGFVRYVLAQHSVPAPRTAAEQYALGTRVDLRNVRAGDLVFFSTVAPGPSHVGLAISAVEFVHAPAASGVVRIDQMRASYWTSRYVGARRVLAATPSPFATE
ncbi:MAG TPA: C40 family peptidase [Vicinamibacterales bacterium]|jgi:cell wall-associated NlpC family hydrolase|nr:C40 family peptidase [Acidobacteriota bacterium]HQX80670.1 C40 family peptidase [Vicinamibacterales bacterium]